MQKKRITQLKRGDKVFLFVRMWEVWKKERDEYVVLKSVNSKRGYLTYYTEVPFCYEEKIKAYKKCEE